MITSGSRSFKDASKYIELTEEEQYAILMHNGLYGPFKYEMQGNETPLYMILLAMVSSVISPPSTSIAVTQNFSLVVQRPLSCDMFILSAETQINGAV